MKIIGIKTNDGYYITDDLKNESNYSGSFTSLVNYIINGEKPEQTFHKKWVKISNEPKLIQHYVNQPMINKRFELIDKTLNDKFKEVWPMDEARWWDNDKDNYVFADGFVAGLYEYKEDAQPQLLQDIEFKYETITAIDEIKTPKFFSYKRSGKWDNSDKYQNVSDKDLKFDMISQIITPAILLHTQPCKLTRKESYDIVRKYIKENINGKVAEVTSDYDFCLTVKKKIKLAKEHVYTVDINDNFFGLLGKRKKKPKYETRIQKQNLVTVFECAPAPYQTYTLLEPFEADSQDELKELIDNYLSHLIGVINEPLQYCECCQGSGVKVDLS